MQSNRSFFRIRFGYLFIVIVCSCLTLLTIQSVVAKPNQSPAGGGYLTLENDSDFVSTAIPWFPDKEFKQLTFEAWVYFDELPLDGSYWCIFSQEGRFEFVLHGFQNGSLGSIVYSFDANCTAISGGGPIFGKGWENRWIHIFASYSAAVGWGLEGNSHNGLQGGSILKSDKPFRIGGLMVQDPNWNSFIGENVKLRGYIDEVRVSDIIRYDPFFKLSYDVPVGKLKSDNHTIGLWHFDGENALKDESGNNYTLWKNEAYAVQKQGKMPIVWGKIKKF